MGAEHQIWATNHRQLPTPDLDFGSTTSLYDRDKNPE